MVGNKNGLKKLRMGIPIHKNVTLGYGENSINVAVVALSVDLMQLIDESVEQYSQQNKDKMNDMVRSQYYNKLLAYYCMRDPLDPKMEKLIANDVDEVGTILDLEDISRIVNAYSELMMNKAPKLEILSQEHYDSLKKHLEVTPLKDLSTVSLVHLANCHQAIISEI